MPTNTELLTGNVAPALPTRTHGEDITFSLREIVMPVATEHLFAGIKIATNSKLPFTDVVNASVESFSPSVAVDTKKFVADTIITTALAAATQPDEVVLRTANAIDMAKPEGDGLLDRYKITQGLRTNANPYEGPVSAMDTLRRDVAVEIATAQIEAHLTHLNGTRPSQALQNEILTTTSGMVTMAVGETLEHQIVTGIPPRQEIYSANTYVTPEITNGQIPTPQARTAPKYRV